jgi:SAM-dependent methyltransferase
MQEMEAMQEHNKLPLYDDKGINLADPHDSLGYKTEYISLIQKKAIQMYLEISGKNALDVGCGYGRMAECLGELGYHVTGVEPSERVISAAAQYQPEHCWKVGALPQLPVSKESFDLVCLFNVARALHLMGIADVCASLPDYVKPGGKLIIIDNIRKDDARFLPEEWFDNFFARNDLKLITKKPIRASRWFMIYLIRYGLIPRKWFDKIADWELHRMSKRKIPPKLSYYNYIYIFKKNDY